MRTLSIDNFNGGSPISLYLLSGFLGSGKTTLLKRLLSGFIGDRIGVIVNEFGDAGIDGAILSLSKEEMKDVKIIEINGGSIFCACLKDGFVRTLKAFAEQPIDMLFIENSGMSDPSSMKHLLSNLAPYLKRQYDYRGSVCLVDCTTFVKYVDAFLPLERQVEASSLILLNKADLCTSEQVEAARKEVLSINPNACVMETTHAAIPPNVLAEKLHAAGDNEKSLNTPQSRPETFLIEDTENTFEPGHVELFCNALSGDAIRIKGFFQGKDGVYHLDVSSGIVKIERMQVSSTSGSRMRNTQIVVIAGSGTQETLIENAWSGIAHRPQEGGLAGNG